MRITTDSDDKVTLSEIVSGHREDLQKRISAMELSGNKDSAEMISKLKDQVQRLDEQYAKAKSEVS